MIYSCSMCMVIWAYRFNWSREHSLRNSFFYLKGLPIQNVTLFVLRYLRNIHKYIFNFFLWENSLVLDLFKIIFNNFGDFAWTNIFEIPHRKILVSKMRKRQKAKLRPAMSIFGVYALLIRKIFMSYSKWKPFMHITIQVQSQSDDTFRHSSTHSFLFQLYIARAPNQF